MSMEFFIELSVWIFAFILLVGLIPRDSVHFACLSFLIMLVPASVLGILVVQYNLIEYPIRFFSDATKTSFTFEFFALPVISAIFNVHYPSTRSLFIKLIYSISFPTVLTILEVLLENHTKLIRYIHWEWYYTWISLLFVLYISYRSTKLFFKTL
ncbi:hypothetical protein JOC48_000642 [Aquibacillus albus]|uniref:Uncharacterized protein n=2 Tax=Aquibacillus albus TaxID=1168171 RepID=A0ABS2MWC8_9BACI|nr:hypothetical protein [Aquibacillus albus]